MKNELKRSESSQQYAAAYTTHYTAHNLPLALRLYQQIVASHPADVEAEYSRMQIKNIVSAVVPKHELLDAEVGMVLAHLEHGGVRS